MGDCHFNKLGFIAPCHETSYRHLFHIFLQVNIVEAKSSRKWLGRRLTSNLLAVNEADNWKFDGFELGVCQSGWQRVYKRTFNSRSY